MKLKKKETNEEVGEKRQNDEEQKQNIVQIIFKSILLCGIET